MFGLALGEGLELSPQRTPPRSERNGESTHRDLSEFDGIDKENESAFKDREDYRPIMMSAHSQRTKPPTDRFIPIRQSGKHSLTFCRGDSEDRIRGGTSESKHSDEDSACKDRTQNLMGSFLRSEIFGLGEGLGDSGVKFRNNNMLRFAPKVRQFDPLGNCGDPQSLPQSPQKKPTGRKIPKVPFKVLDAPALQDDFYLNLLDWSSSNLLSVGLGSCVYLWSGSNSRVFKVCDLGGEELVTSVNWANQGELLGVGTSQGEVHIWDINQVKKVRTLQGHSSRVGALAWSQNCVASGSRDKSILLRDIRESDSFYERLLGHKQEVCGLKWSCDSQLFASGGNDNKMFIWTSKSTTPVFKTSAHKAAVKALAWSPHQHGLLASGGGTADKCIRFWNAHTGKMVNSIDTGSQVCNLLFSRNVNELISTHGYTENQIHLWSYPTMRKLHTLTGHTYRVLYLAMSPDGKSIVTGAGDETLRFWDLFPRTETSESTSDLVPIHKISIR